jgi:hypothetical protein
MPLRNFNDSSTRSTISRQANFRHSNHSACPLDQVILAAIPLIMTVDWIIARARSGVNVMSDMLVAILLDVGKTAPGTKAHAEVGR